MRPYYKNKYKQGQMNKTELAYSNYLELLKRVGEVIDYKFESIKFRLADKTFYTPDFLVKEIGNVAGCICLSLISRFS